MKFGEKESVTITKNKKEYNQVVLTMKVTQGKVMSILHALEGSSSPVAEDVKNMIESALKEADLDLNKL